MCKQISSDSFKNKITSKLFIYNSNMYKQDLALNNQQGLIYHTTQSTNGDESKS